jgi:multimeric flavodoxin WrbA
MADLEESNIAIITGSPKKDGNSAILAESFIKGAAEAGHQITRFDSSFTEINPCYGL